MISEGRATKPGWIKGNTFTSDGDCMIEPVQFGDLSGHKVSIGAHCGGQHTYYFPFGDGHVIAERPFCYAWEDCGPDCEQRLKFVPGIITEEAADQLFAEIMATIATLQETSH